MLKVCTYDVCPARLPLVCHDHPFTSKVTFNIQLLDWQFHNVLQCARRVKVTFCRHQPATQSCQMLLHGAGSTSHYPQQVVRSEPEVARWHGSDSGGFDEVPLGSPPLKAASADSNGGPPHLEKVAHSLRAYSKAEAGPQDIAATEASQLRTENASLKQRLSAIENVRTYTPIIAAPLPYGFWHLLVWSKSGMLATGMELDKQIPVQRTADMQGSLRLAERHAGSC